ncbi:myosin heavy chain, fast skeletal muscle-like [Acyrthosiphon pisum]|uniref:Uncharacterized protein n=1 Tax=Acyrthosiphon pisum TaxID=7029 RepID=A0A8R2ACP0_ACYPI|nr:myosin heavy chain, fast skeletal muscle-like [Acyrthosiphon pisum]|eukprot:XP_003247973.1 PREDICTED: myosin heavy chain, fast skeletal muscle-like [Acyrthosiphon pisum]
MCTNDIASKLNHWEISVNPHQNEKNRQALVREHFEKLSDLLAGSAHVNFKIDRDANHFLEDAAVEVDRRIVDLKGMEKLTELCSFLRKNVDDLKSVFNKRRRTRGGYYTKSEIADLEQELGSLDEDVWRMMDTLNSIAGNQWEIKQVLKMYTECESRYVRLRSLNKSARLRFQASKTKNDIKDDGFNVGVCEIILKWVLGCPFIATQDKNVKPAAEAAEGDGTIDRGPLVLGGKEKLVRLCSFLRTNVIDLINYYDIARRRVSGAYYTGSENTDLESGLQSLKDDVEKLLDTVNDISGYRIEIKHVLAMYTEQEARYRALRLLNKGAMLRHQTENG